MNTLYDGRRWMWLAKGGALGLSSLQKLTYVYIRHTGSPTNQPHPSDPNHVSSISPLLSVYPRPLLLLV